MRTAFARPGVQFGKVRVNSPVLHPRAFLKPMLQPTETPQPLPVNAGSGLTDVLMGKLEGRRCPSWIWMTNADVLEGGSGDKGNTR